MIEKNSLPLKISVIRTRRTAETITAKYRLGKKERWIRFIEIDHDEVKETNILPSQISVIRTRRTREMITVKCKLEKIGIWIRFITMMK